MTIALWIFVCICMAGAAFMLRFLFAMQGDLRKGTRLEAEPEEIEPRHYEFEIADPAATPPTATRRYGRRPVLLTFESGRGGREGSWLT